MSKLFNIVKVNHILPSQIIFAFSPVCNRHNLPS
jgi:hypothetical protein